MIATLKNACILATSIVLLQSTARAQDTNSEADVSPNPLHNFNYASVGYAYRVHGNGIDGDGRSQEAELVYSKEWSWKRSSYELGLQLAPSLSFAVGQYDARPASSHTIQVGTRLGVLLHSKDRLVTLSPFADLHWASDSIQGRQREGAILVSPGIQATLRLNPAWALQLGYRYLGFTEHEVTDQGLGYRRLDNSVDHEFRMGFAFAPFASSKGPLRNVVAQFGALTYANLFSNQPEPRPTAVGAYLAIRYTL